MTFYIIIQNSIARNVVVRTDQSVLLWLWT